MMSEKKGIKIRFSRSIYLFMRKKQWNHCSYAVLLSELLLGMGCRAEIETLLFDISIRH